MSSVQLAYGVPLMHYWPPLMQGVGDALTGRNLMPENSGRRLSSVVDHHPAVLAARERVAQKQQSMTTNQMRRLHQSQSAFSGSFVVILKLCC